MVDLLVTRKINIIESLKSSALYKIADIFGYDDGSKTEAAADLIILLYILAAEMGASYSETDKKIIERLTAGIKTEESDWRGELSLLLRHFEERV